MHQQCNEITSSGLDEDYGMSNNNYLAPEHEGTSSSPSSIVSLGVSPSSSQSYNSNLPILCSNFRRFTPYSLPSSSANVLYKPASSSNRVQEVFNYPPMEFIETKKSRPGFYTPSSYSQPNAQILQSSSNSPETETYSSTFEIVSPSTSRYSPHASTSQSNAPLPSYSSIRHSPYTFSSRSIPCPPKPLSDQSVLLYPPNETSTSDSPLYSSSIYLPDGDQYSQYYSDLSPRHYTETPRNSPSQLTSYSIAMDHDYFNCPD